MYCIEQAVEDVQEAEVADISVTPSRITKLIDRFGNRFIFANGGDIWLPPLLIGKDTSYHKHLRAVRDINIRDNDILICSYPKSGLHWHMEMVSMLVKQQVEYTSPEDFRKAYLELDTLSHAHDEPDDEKPHIRFTHLPFRYLPRQVLEKKIKIIHLVRNPKDVMSSLYCQVHSVLPPLDFAGTFEHFVFLMLECGYHYGSIFDHLMSFQDGGEDHSDLPVCTSIFEDMKKNPVESIKRINTFLGTGCSEEFCQQIADACQFRKVKTHKTANTDSFEKLVFRKGSTGFYRKGDVGDWKNWFTVAMNDVFDEEYQKRMADYKITFQYE